MTLQASDNYSGGMDDDELRAQGFTEEMLTNPKDIGIMVLAAPDIGGVDAMIEKGLLVVIVKDEPCPEGPHEHGPDDHRPLYAGRITYQKALNVAQALLKFAADVTPLDKTEKRIVERINEGIAEMTRRRQEHEAGATETESEGGNAVNLI